MGRKSMGRSSVYKFLSSINEYGFSFAIYSLPHAAHLLRRVAITARAPALRDSRRVQYLSNLSRIFFVCPQPFPRQFNRFVKFLLQQYHFHIRNELSFTFCVLRFDGYRQLAFPLL
jgi:hypothetical protein